MIPFPQQSVQQKHEYDSLSILGYVLKDVGIMRNVAINDFGIDLEFDLVEGSDVTGRIFKAQVKSSQELTKDANGQVTVGNIKQSTLSYWMRISLYCPVVVFAVDVKTEKIYYSEPIHMQAALLIDGTDATKTIRLKHCLSEGREFAQRYNRVLEAALLKQQIPDEVYPEVVGILRAAKEKLDRQNARRDLMIAYLGLISSIGNLREQKILHMDCLRQLDGLIELKNEWTNYRMDRGTEIFEPSTFRFFLKATWVFVGYWPIQDYCRTNGLDIARVYSEDYWEDRSNEILKPEKYRVGITYEGIRDHIPHLVDLLLTYLAERRADMLGGEAHYWIHEDLHYLEAVFQTPIPGAQGGNVPAQRFFEAFVGDVQAKTAARIAHYESLKKRRSRAKASAPKKKKIRKNTKTGK